VYSHIHVHIYDVGSIDSSATASHPASSSAAWQVSGAPTPLVELSGSINTTRAVSLATPEPQPHHSPPPPSSALRNTPRRCRNTLGKPYHCTPPRRPSTNQAPPLPDPASRSSQSPTSSMSAPCTKSTAKPPPSLSRMSPPTVPKAAPPTLPQSNLARTRSTSTSSFAVAT
jgi:hypothetical protein